MLCRSMSPRIRYIFAKAPRTFVRCSRHCDAVAIFFKFPLI
jgi:hypothetical protein